MVLTTVAKKVQHNNMYIYLYIALSEEENFQDT